MKIKLPNKNKLFEPGQILIMSFFFLIVSGTFLLMLPQTTYVRHLNFIDALFTATSAVCSTGLVVVDTGSTFTPFGQAIILVLIQVGGLGIMTLSSFFLFLIFRHLSISDRDLIQESLTQHPIKNLASLLRITFGFTIVIEAVGALFLTIRFSQTFPVKKAFYYGIFHSVSAYCNAGFALFPNSMVNFKTDIIVNVIIMALIVIGGLGFIVLLDLRHGIRKNLFSLTFHSRFVLVLTISLILIGAIFFYLLEMKNILSGESLRSSMLISIFQSVTSRTAGFNTIQVSMLANETLFFLILLMFIGGGSGSCAGGIKITTFGIMIAFMITKFRNQQEINIFNRRLSPEVSSRAISITFFSMSVIILFTLALLVSELGDVAHQQSRGLFLEILFEVVSAFGTVGLSTGVTATLSVFGKFMISLMMFVGKLGPLTIALAIGAKEPLKYRYPKEKVLVG